MGWVKGGGALSWLFFREGKGESFVYYVCFRPEFNSGFLPPP